MNIKLAAQEEFAQDFSTLILLQKQDVEQYEAEFLRLQGILKDQNLNNELISLYDLHYDFLFEKGQHQKAIQFLHQTRKLKRNTNASKLADIYLELAINFHAVSNLDSLVYWTEKSEALINSKSELYAKYLYVNSLKSSFEGNYDQAINGLLSAIDRFVLQNDTTYLPLVYNSLAFDFGRLGEYKKQRGYLYKSIEINRRSNNQSALISDYNNLGSSFKQDDLLSPALKYYDLAYNLLNEKGSPMLLAQNLTNRANIYEKLGDYLQAEKLFLECKKISEANKIGYGILISNLNLGNLYRLMHEYAKAENYLTQGLSMAQQMKLKKETALSYERLAWLNREIGDFKDAYDFLNRYQLLNDSIVNESVRNNSNELREKYEAEKKENQIITLSRNKLYQQYIIAIMAVVLLLLLAFIQWRVNTLKLTQIKLSSAESLHQVQYEDLKRREEDLLKETMEKIALKEQIKDLITKSSNGFDNRKLKKELLSFDKKQNPWNDMIEKFKLLNPDFVASLLKTYPQLSQSDLEFCSLIKMGLTTKEISTILRITDQSVRTKKYRLLKKLGMSKETDLSYLVRTFEV